MLPPPPPPPTATNFTQPQSQQHVHIQTQAQSQLQQTDDMLVIFMPYLHWESDKDRRKLVESIRSTSGSIEDSKIGRMEKDEILIHGYPVDLSNDFHPRRTLDQFKHHSTDTDPQDADQVVYRYCKNHDEVPKIYMVDQLWIVTVGDLLISCFPERWGQPRRDALNLFDGVVEDINSTTRPPVRNVYELALLITERCTGIFDRHQWGEEELLFAEKFDLSIGILTRKETALFSRFKNDSGVAAHWLKAHGKSSTIYQKDLVAAQEDYNSKQLGHEDDDVNLAGQSDVGISGEDDIDAEEFVNKLLNVDEEAALLVECKDIEDELEILATVLRQQQQVLDSIVGELGVSKESSGQGLDLSSKLGEQQRLVDADVLDPGRMARQARSVNENLTQILDLKQKHANAVEARFQRYQAQEAARQGLTIMVFTVVTIVFLPLSFLASLFTISIVEFPRPPDSTPGELHLGWVLKYVLGIGLGVSIPLIFFAFVVGDVRAWWVRRRLKKSHLQMKKSTVEPNLSRSASNEDGRQGEGVTRTNSILRRRRGETGIRGQGDEADEKFLTIERVQTLIHRTSKNSIPPVLPTLQVPERQPMSSMESDRSANPFRKRLRRTLTDRTERSAATDDLEVGRTDGR